MADQEQRRLAAIMFTDMVGYSAMTQDDEEHALRLLDEHFRLVRPILSQHGGREIKTIGDAFLVEFDSALRAVQCAVQIQRALGERNSAVARADQIHVRVGVHLGDVEHRANDVFGDGVNIAARIEPLAEPDGICLSEDVARQVQGKLEFPIVELGLGDLKNIRLPVRIYRVELPWVSGSSLPKKHSLRLRKLTWRKKLALVVVAIGVLAWAALLLRPAKRAMFISLLPPQGSTLYRESPPAISPDGSAVVFVADDDSGDRLLLIRRFDEPEARKLASLGSAEGLPFWKPDGEWIGFFANGKLRKIRKGGTELEDICDLPDHAMGGFGATWSNAGDIVFVPAYGKGLLHVSENGMARPPIAVPRASQREAAYAWPQFLADGRRFLFVACTTSKESNEIRLGSLDESWQPSTLAKADGLIGFQKPWLVITRKDRMYAQKINLTTAKADGDEIRITSNIYYDESLATAPASMSASGAIAYFAAGVPTVQLQWVDRSGRVLEQIGRRVDGVSSPNLSPDGKRIALNHVNRKTETRDVAVLDRSSGRLSVITSGADCEEPYWINNDHVVYASDANGFYDIFEQDLIGSKATIIWRSRGDKYVADVSSVGNFALVITEADGKIWKVPLSGTSIPDNVSASNYSARDAAISRDGRWLAFIASRTDSEDERAHVYASRLPDGLLVPISSDAATNVEWSRDGTQVFYRRTDGMLMCVPVRKSGDAIAAAAPKPLFSLQMMVGETFDVSTDAQRFLIPTAITKPTSEVKVLTGWEGKLAGLP